MFYLRPIKPQIKKIRGGQTNHPGVISNLVTVRFYLRAAGMR